MRVIALIAFLLPLAAAAQVYTWKDASGKIHYSDQPPPDQGTRSRVLPTDSTDVADPAAIKATAERRLELNKESKDKQEAAAKAAKEKAQEAQRAKDCERARQNLQGIESGQIRFRMGANGEREALDDSARAAELANARRAMDASCSPTPSAPAKPSSSY
jgi:hypothetical protein